MNSLPKLPTLAAVKYAALLLIETAGETTTLDVKNLLRKMGYTAYQDDVSALLDEAGVELPLEFTVSDGPIAFRVYTLPKNVVVSGDQNSDDEFEDDDDNQSLASKISIMSPQVVGQEYVSRAGETVTAFESIRDVNEAGLQVTRVSRGPDGHDLFYGHDVRRDLARSAHAHIRNVDYNDTRSWSYEV